MDDFYVYYEPVPNNILVGQIKAISPNQLQEMAELDHIRIPSEQGLSYTVGTESISGWAVMWDASKEAMTLQKAESSATVNSAEIIIAPVSMRTKKPQVTVTYTSGVFNVKTKGVSLSQPNVNLTFFATRLDDPNIPYFHFKVPLHESMQRKGVDIECDVDLPEKFSIYTKFEVSRYLFRIQS